MPGGPGAPAEPAGRTGQHASTRPGSAPRSPACPARSWSSIKPEPDALYARYLDEADGRRPSARRRWSRCWPCPCAARAAWGRCCCRSPPPASRDRRPGGGRRGLGILHLVGLLLTVAVGSNYALFFDHLRARRPVDEDTLASLLLANLTTVVSFGLLAISRSRCCPRSARWWRRAPCCACCSRRASSAGRNTAKAWENRRMTLPAYVTASAALHAAGRRRGRCSHRPCWPWRSARSAPTTWCSPPAGSGRARAGSAATGPACPRPRRRGGRSRSRSTTGPIRRSRRPVLDLLDAHQARATFFASPRPPRAIPPCAARSCAAATACRTTAIAIRDAFSLLGPRGLEAEIECGAGACSPTWPASRRASSARPPGCAIPCSHRCCTARPGAGELDPARLRHGPARAVRVLARLCDGLDAGDILLLHDGHAARTAPGQPVILAVLPALLERTARAGLRPTTLADALPAPRRTRPTRSRRPPDDSRGSGAGLAGAGRAGERLVPARRPLRPGTSPAASCAGIRCSAIS